MCEGTPKFPKLSNHRTYLLFDTAERTYGDYDLWGVFFQNLPTNYHVLLFSESGRPPSFKGVVREDGAPDKAGYDKHVLLWPTPDTPRGLFLTRDEFDDFVWRYSSCVMSKFIRLAPDLRETIFN